MRLRGRSPTAGAAATSAPTTPRSPATGWRRSHATGPSWPPRCGSRWPRRRRRTARSPRCRRRRRSCSSASAPQAAARLEPRAARRRGPPRLPTTSTRPGQHGAGGEAHCSPTATGASEHRDRGLGRQHERRPRPCAGTRCSAAHLGVQREQRGHRRARAPSRPRRRAQPSASAIVGDLRGDHRPRLPEPGRRARSRRGRPGRVRRRRARPARLRRAAAKHGDADGRRPRSPPPRRRARPASTPSRRADDRESVSALDPLSEAPLREDDEQAEAEHERRLHDAERREAPARAAAARVRTRRAPSRPATSRRRASRSSSGASARRRPPVRRPPGRRNRARSRRRPRRRRRGRRRSPRFAIGKMLA